jgi:acyl-CoA thioesterase
VPIVTVKQILECLELQPAPSGFTASNLPIEYHRVFGGQVLAQAIVAAARTVEDKVPKSLSATFCREGRPEEPITYDVQVTHDGRAFATRNVTARQDDRVVAVLSVSLARPETEHGLDYQTRTAPPGPPERGDIDLVMVPFESRLANGVDLGSVASEPPELVIWMRGCDVPRDEVTQRAVLAYVTNPTLIGTALRALDGVSVNEAYATTQTAITTHSLWFHRPVDLDGWFVLDQTAPVAAGGQAFGFGHAFDRSGSHLASYAQESMIRAG